MANYDYVTNTGVILADTSSVKSEVEDEFRQVFGADFSTDPSSLQGRLIDAEVTSRISVLRNNAKVANQINPNLAEGVFLDAVYKLTGGERDSKERSTVTCTLSGVNGAFIPWGSLVSNDNGDNFESSVDVTIPASGSIDTSFLATEYGVIQSAANTITKVVTSVLGWETVNNPTPAVAGKLEQTDVSTRAQRSREIAANANRNSLAIISAVSQLENVNSVSFRENKSGVPIVIDTKTLVSHSTYLIVDGGTDVEVATAYYDSRSGGSDFNGETLYIVTDPTSQQQIPVLFDRPTLKPKLVRITAKILSGSQPEDEIKQAIIDYSNSEAFFIGLDVSAIEVACAVNESISSIFVASCEIAEKPAAVYTSGTLETLFFEKATIEDLADIEVTLL